MARVQILPEKSLSPMQPWLSSKLIHQRSSLLDRAVHTNSWTSYRASLDTRVSPFAGLVIQQFDCHSLAAQVRLQIKKLMAIDDSSMELVPTEPHSLSFWAANNLLMDDEGRLKLLEQDNIVYRLRTVLELINKVIFSIYIYILWLSLKIIWLIIFLILATRLFVLRLRFACSGSHGCDPHMQPRKQSLF